MKRSITAWMVLGAVLFGTAGAAAAGPQALRINVPFAFYVGKELYSAGDYVFEMQSPTVYAATASAIFIRRGDGEALRWVMTMPNQGLSRHPGGRATFHRYGDAYFLSSVECNNFRADLKVTPRERELLAEVITLK
ncbi:MAG: hypothetical protein HXY20_14805 [Acidobacteria bacterium]|nr:hypothetical protein [Acidobacteriota bacterium]